MFNKNYEKLLSLGSGEWTPQSDRRQIGPGLRINSNDSAVLDISWRVRQTAKYKIFGYQGRFLELYLDDVSEVHRKTVSFVDSTKVKSGQSQHFLCIARAVNATKVIVSAAQRKNNRKFNDVFRGYQAIGTEPTALSISLPVYSDQEQPKAKGAFRFNLTCERPGPITIQIFDVRYCVT